MPLCTRAHLRTEPVAPRDIDVLSHDPLEVNRDARVREEVVGHLVCELDDQVHVAVHSVLRAHDRAKHRDVDDGAHTQFDFVRAGLRLAAVEPLGVARVVGPGAIAYPPRTQLVPDVLVYPRRFSRGTPCSQIAEHWLAVEIYSPSSRIYDREFKRAAYLHLGVREIWLVDADAHTVELCRATGTSHVMRDRVTWTVPDTDHDVVIELAGLFEDSV